MRGRGVRTVAIDHLLGVFYRRDFHIGTGSSTLKRALVSMEGLKALTRCIYGSTTSSPITLSPCFMLLVLHSKHRGDLKLYHDISP